MEPKAPHASDEFFQEGLSEWDPTLDRRQFLKLSSAALALAGLSACVKPPLEKIFSYVSEPEEMVPGEPQFFATHFNLGGFANGLLVESHEGRPTHIEGNPGHPANRGSASALHQALVLSLYDPDRIQHTLHRGENSSFAAFTQALSKKLDDLQAVQGKGLAIVSEATSSDTFTTQKEALQKKFPQMTWVEYEPLVNHHAEQAAKEIYGEPLSNVFDLTKASVIVSIDSDFLSHPHSPLSYAKDFANQEATRLFAIESSHTLTGAKAKHRLPLKPSQLLAFTRTLAQTLLHPSTLPTHLSSEEIHFLTSLVSAIEVAKGNVVFIAGEQQTVETHAYCHLLNDQFAKDARRMIRRKAPSDQDGIKGLGALTLAMESKMIDTLLILGGNPVYTSPGSLDFKSALKNVGFTAHLSAAENETNENVEWVIPEAHPLEAWQDGRAFDGTLSFSQPLIAPMYDGITVTEFLHFVLTRVVKSGRDLLDIQYTKQWKQELGARLSQALRQGYVEGSASASVKAHARTSVKGIQTEPVERVEGLELSFHEDRKVYDGRFANHPWLQEFPDPLTRLTWGNAILAHPDTLTAHSLKMGDVIEITVSNRSIKGPVYADPFQAKESLAIHFGYGRTKAGSVGTGIGFNAYPLWAGRHFAQSVSLMKTAQNETLASTQEHHSMEGRNIVRTVKPNQSASTVKEQASLYPADPLPDAKEAWAMSIDLDRCTGCGACVVACQSENNIPTVGRAGVLLGREMHWIRVDRYFEDSETPVAHFQPVPCMHCEKAPCEPVCPTGATLHGDGGLNQMVYNRCVGTRYCSNNCPYKVRRFNFLTYNDKNSKLAARSKNPNVTVRTRGVMEKCTYCVQRISAARIKSARDKTPMQDGSVKTACQTTCPSDAIVFGNLRDPESKVSKLRQSFRNYGLLEELGTKPRTTYLAKVIREDA